VNHYIDILKKMFPLCREREREREREGKKLTLCFIAVIL
jgi:hypothetical protein